MSKSLKLTIVGAAIIGFILAVFLGPIYWINTKQLTNTENMLLSQLQMILSIIITWIITHLYSKEQEKHALSQTEESHKTNLRSYARQAAEKVNNLSTQLDKLSDYLRIELEDTYTQDNTKDALLAIAERMSSAIQIVNTLKSVNDTSLSDWQGVIGDLLEEQREEKEEKEKELREFIEKTLPIFDEKIVSNENDQNDERVDELKKSVDSLKNDLRELIANKTSSSIRIGSIGSTREDIVSRCPECNAIVSYRQSKRSRKPRGVECKSCKTQLVSLFYPKKGFKLETRRPVPEDINCPECKHRFSVDIDNLASPPIPTNCPNCSAELTVRRKSNKIKIYPTNKPATEHSPEFLDLVKEALPPQPWPINTHKVVATELKASNNSVRGAIQALINRGDYFPQINGVVFYPEQTTKKEGDNVISA